MNIFPRKSKNAQGAYYFGEFDDKPLAPFSISVATFDKDFTGEQKHYHTTNQKVYIAVMGKGLLNVNGKEIELAPEQMIHVEPNEVHYVSAVMKAPLQIVVVLESKINDKVIV